MTPQVRQPRFLLFRHKMLMTEALGSANEIATKSSITVLIWLFGGLVLDLTDLLAQEWPN